MRSAWTATPRCLTPTRRPQNQNLPSGVASFDVSLEKQRVTVRGDVTPEAVLEVVKTTGKKAELAK